MNAINVKIVGAAGEGVKATGLTLAKTALGSGYYVHGYTEYPSLIRGGHNTFQVLIADHPLTSLQRKVDLIVSLNSQAYKKHLSELAKNAVVLVDNGSSEEKLCEVPFSRLAEEIGATRVMKNTVAIGAVCSLIGLERKILNTVIAQMFAKKADEIVSLNQKAAKSGYLYIEKHYLDKKLIEIQKPKLGKTIFLTGNEAIVLGAIAGGMKYFGAYPMTPATSILHELASKADKHGLVVRHAEDEIGVVNQAIGAAYAGARAMVATSGGGFSLMTEALGLAGMTEIPLVVVLAMRPGPSSGMPTWTGQGDLLFAIHASQDEFPRIVLTPGDVGEAFESARFAQGLAEKYQVPVIIMTDKYLGESYFTTEKFSEKYQNKRYGFMKVTTKNSVAPYPRYALTKSGVSTRAVPGQVGGVHLANSYEHDVFGYATEETSERTQQVDKRNRKILSLIKSGQLPKPVLFGKKRVKRMIVSWGSNKGSIIEALQGLKDTSFVHLPCVSPFPIKEFREMVDRVKEIITLECNSTAQLAKLIRMETGIEIKRKLLKYDGRPFFPAEIVEVLK